MKDKTWFYSLLLPFILLASLPGCVPKEEPEAAQLTTNSITDITQTTATSGGTILTDGGATLTAKGVCWSIFFPPDLSGNHTNEGSGSGSFTSYLTGLAAGNTYYVRAYAINEAGTSFGETQSFTAGGGGGGGTVTDIDGNIYNTVTIGTQIWMKENLKVTRYRNGDAIPNQTDATAWSTTTAGAYCNYDNIIGNGDTYGRLYNWAAIDDSRNIAPTGWHVPDFTEWTTLINHLGGAAVAGEKLKETGTQHWNSPNVANNSSGFTAISTGLRDQTGSYFGVGYTAHWWSSTEQDAVYSWGFSISHDQPNINTVVFEKPLGFPVRCIKD